MRYGVGATTKFKLRKKVFNIFRLARKLWNRRKVENSSFYNRSRKIILPQNIIAIELKELPCSWTCFTHKQNTISNSNLTICYNSECWGIFFLTVAGEAPSSSSLEVVKLQELHTFVKSQAAVLHRALFSVVWGQRAGAENVRLPPFAQLILTARFPSMVGVKAQVKLWLGNALITGRGHGKVGLRLDITENWRLSLAILVWVGTQIDVAFCCRCSKNYETGSFTTGNWQFTMKHWCLRMNW